MNKIISNLKNCFLTTDYFKYVFLIFSMSICIPPLHVITSSLFKFILGWGILLVAYDFIDKKKFIRSKNSFVLFLFLSSCLLSILINKNSLSNFKIFLYATVPIMLFYSDYVDRNMIEIKNELRKISLVYCSITFISSVISLFMFFIQLSEVRFSKATQFYTLGILEGRLYGIYVSPNAGAICALISIILSIFLLYLVNLNKDRKKSTIIYRIFSISNILIEFMYISLTDSKGTKLVIMFFSSIFAFLLYYFIDLRIYSSKQFKRGLISSLFSILACINSIVLLNLTSKFLSFIPSFIESLEHRGENDLFNIKPIFVERTYVDSEIGSYRLTLWRIGFEILKDHPIFGVGQKNLYDEGMRVNLEHNLEISEDAIKSLHYGMHNLYMQILVGFGIVSFAIFALFFISNYFQLLRSLFKKKSEDIFIFILLFSFVSSMLFGNSFESTILFSNTGIESIFWFIFGYCMLFIKNTEKSNDILNFKKIKLIFGKVMKIGDKN